jgi:hypothetical protein
MKVLDNKTAGTTFEFARDLHNMYDLIFSEAFAVLDDDEQDLSRRCLMALVSAYEPLSVLDYSKLHNTSLAQIRNAFENLHSVVKVPNPPLSGGDDDPDAVITVHHHSIIEYLTTKSAQSKWTSSVRAGHLHMTKSCALVFRNHLHFGVSGIRNSDKSLSDLSTSSIDAIPSYLLYASFYWAKHWVEVFSDEATPSTSSTNDGEDCLIELCTKFLGEKFLYWLELLAASRKLHLASKSLIQIRTVSIYNRF